MGEKSREYFAAWLSTHRPNFVVVHTENSTSFFRHPLSITIKRQGKGYLFSIVTNKGIYETELEEGFNAFCPDKYTENSISIMDMKNSIEIVERYQKDEF